MPLPCTGSGGVACGKFEYESNIPTVEKAIFTPEMTISEKRQLRSSDQMKIAGMEQRVVKTTSLVAN